MIAHVSIPARNPELVAKALGKVIAGSVFPFPVVPGAFIVIADDASGQAIEVYPEGMMHHPGKGQPPAEEGPPTIRTKEWEDQIFPEPVASRLTSHHVALTTSLSEEQVVELGRGLDFRAVRCDRAGVFRLVELWIDNSFLIEVLTDREAARLKEFMQPTVAAKMFGPSLK